MEGHRSNVLLVLFLATWTCCAFGTAPLKLLGKTSHSSMVQGILQIYYNNKWGTICNTYWSKIQTDIACRQLGYVKGVANKHLGQGLGPIWLDQVRCNGAEGAVDQCSHQAWGSYSCTGHSQDVGIVCYTDVKVRLIDGDVASSGRVQLFHHGVWKNLCDNNWNANAANVICRMAGFDNGSAVAIRRYKGSSDVWLSSYICSGFESSIEACTNLNWGQASCSSDNLAWVVCKPESPSVAFRLVGGPVAHAGRLEMGYYGSFGATCGRHYNGINLNDAHVICRMMGYSQALVVNNQYEGLALRYSLHIHCTGSENTTQQCGGYSINYYCWYQRSIRIICRPQADFKFAVRLVDGISLNQGRVEVRYYGVWGTVCRYSSWTLKDANVVCRMLGYRNASWAGHARVRGKGFILRAHQGCHGNETSLEDCTSYNYNHYCDHYNDVGVRCTSQYQIPLTVQVRLADDKNPHSGRVSVRYGNTWGTLCYEGLDYNDVKVICRMLGYVDVSQVYAVPTPSSVNGRVWLSNLECNGTETSVLNCSRPGWWQTTCDFDAAVTCKSGISTVSVRLEDGKSPNSGRVGVRFGNTWGALCNKGLDMIDAKVICRMLGYVGVSRVYTSPGNGTLWLSNLGCNGGENSIVDCSHSGWWQTNGCNHGDDAAITCKIADAPHFQIDSSNAITDSTVIVSLAKATQRVDARLKSSYQFIVEKSHEIQSPIKSNGNISLPYFYGSSAIIKAVWKNSHTAAEVPVMNVASRFTIGDGLNYNGYRNAPLEPGCMYRVYVRVVTMAMDRKKVFGESSFVTFTTKQKSEPPSFQISDSSSIKDTSVVINFLDRQPKGPRVDRWFQVAVEKTGKDVYRSKGSGINNTYIVAEIPSTNSSFTIGDGQDHYGYHNAPLEPGCTYRVDVRFITMTTNGKRISSDVSFVSFTTKTNNQGRSDESSSAKESTVTGLSVTLVIVIIAFMALIGYIVFNLVIKRRKRREGNNNNPQIEISDLNATSGASSKESADQQYQELNFPNHCSTTGASSSTSHGPEEQLYQSLTPRRGQHNRGYEEQDSSAYHVSNIRPQARQNVYQMEEPTYDNIDYNPQC